MKANIEAMVIEMSKAESKAVGKVNSNEFKELADLRAAYPNFRIVIRASKRKDSMKGLTVAYMEKFIKAHDDEDGTILMEFYTLRGLDENGNKVDFTIPAPYGQLKLWFLSKYPTVGQMTETVNRVIEQAKKNREAQKAAKQAA